MKDCFQTIDLFSGIGGLALGVHPVLRASPLCYCDIDPMSHAIIGARQKEGALPRAPILGDVKGVRAEYWRDRPNTMTVAGFPCTNISSMGNGLGLEGEQSGLFYETMRIATESASDWIFLENVAAIRTTGLEGVLYELDREGYDARFAVFSAEDDGAPHVRKRWYCLARRRDRRRRVAPAAFATRPSKSSWWRADGRRDPPPTARFVEGRQSASSPQVARCMALGNAVVPQTAASALAYLLSGGVAPPARALSPERAHASWEASRAHFATPCAQSRAVRQIAPEMPVHGSLTAAGLVENAAPPKRHWIRRPLIVLVPRGLSDRSQAERVTSGVVEDKVRLSRWSTPRYGTWNCACTLSNRACKDLANQLLFDHRTPARVYERASKRLMCVDPCFVENMMGYERNWTSPHPRRGMPRGAGPPAPAAGMFEEPTGGTEPVLVSLARRKRAPRASPRSPRPRSDAAAERASLRSARAHAARRANAARALVEEAEMAERAAARTAEQSSARAARAAARAAC